jgi:hypothetical protein
MTPLQFERSVSWAIFPEKNPRYLSAFLVIADNRGVTAKVVIHFDAELRSLMKHSNKNSFRRILPLIASHNKELARHRSRPAISLNV